MARSLKIQFWFLGLGLIFLDQISKYLILRLPGKEFFLLNTSYLQIALSPLKNAGLAFGLDASYWINLSLSGIIIIILALWLFRIYAGQPRSLILSLIILISGALSNFLDRIIHAGVIDFLSFKIYNFSWPSFNFADIIIVASIISLIIIFLKQKSLCFSKDSRSL